MHSQPLGPVYGYADKPTFGCFASSNLPPRDSDRKSIPARANSTPKYTASSTRTARLDAVVAEVAATDDEAVGTAARTAANTSSGRRTRCFARAAVAVRPRVPRREERRHRVGVREVELDAVEAGRGGAAAPRPRRCRAALRQVADVRLLNVGHALAIAELERLELARTEDRSQLLVRQRQQRGADRVVSRPPQPARRRGAHPLSAGSGEERFFRRPPADGEEVDDLDEESRAAAAGATDGLDEIAQTRNEPVVADAQQRPARDVADAGGLDDDRAGLPLRKALVPLRGRPVSRSRPRSRATAPSRAPTCDPPVAAVLRTAG